MSTSINPKLAALHDLLPLRQDKVDAFLGLVAEVVNLGDSRSIPELLMILDENCSLSGVMDAVSRNLEEFPPDVFVPQLLGTLPSLCAKSPFWCQNEIRKYLWAPSFRQILISCIPASGVDTKRVLGTVVRSIQAETSMLAEGCTQVLAALDE